MSLISTLPPTEESIKSFIENNLNSIFSFGEPTQIDEKVKNQIHLVLQQLEVNPNVGCKLTEELRNHHPTLEQLRGGRTYCITSKNINSNSKEKGVIFKTTRSVEIKWDKILIRTYCSSEQQEFQCERYSLKGGSFRFNHFPRKVTTDCKLQNEIKNIAKQISTIDLTLTLKKPEKNGRGRYVKLPKYSQVFPFTSKRCNSTGRRLHLCIKLGCPCGQKAFHTSHELLKHWTLTYNIQKNEIELYQQKWGVRLFTNDPLKNVSLNQFEISFLAFDQLLEEFKFREKSTWEWSNITLEVFNDEMVKYIEQNPHILEGWEVQSSDSLEEQSEDESFMDIDLDTSLPDEGLELSEEQSIREEIYEGSHNGLKMKIISQSDKITLIINGHHLEITEIRCPFDKLFKILKSMWLKLPVVRQLSGDLDGNDYFKFSCENNGDEFNLCAIKTYNSKQKEMEFVEGINIGRLIIHFSKKGCLISNLFQREDQFYFLFINAQSRSNVKEILLPNSEDQCLQIGIDSDYSYAMERGPLTDKKCLEWHSASQPKPPTYEVQYATYISSQSSTGETFQIIVVSHRSCANRYCTHDEFAHDCVLKHIESISRVLLVFGGNVLDMVQERRLAKVVKSIRNASLIRNKAPIIPYYCFDTFYKGNIPMIVNKTE